MKYFLILAFLSIAPLTVGKLYGGDKPKLEKAVFAAGCFWCAEAAFEKLEGVQEVISGYTGGEEKNPTYHQVGSGKTGHLEAVELTYNPDKINYQELLEFYWRQFDPTDGGGSFVDRGRQYTSAIFYHNEEQKRLAETSRRQLEESGVFSKPVVTSILPAEKFYPAEEYHQDYYKKNPAHYNRYRSGSGRDQFIEKIWGKKHSFNQTLTKPSEEVLKKKLTPLQYQVTQEEGTERPFENEYWDNKREGIYVDIVSGEPLFSSHDKYKSGTGWPSFTRPLESKNIVEKTDRKLWVARTEVRSKQGDSHLGHLFKDGPQPTGLRYCINSAALRFIPKDELEKEGYGAYKKLFEK